MPDYPNVTDPEHRRQLAYIDREISRTDRDWPVGVLIGRRAEILRRYGVSTEAATVPAPTETGVYVYDPEQSQVRAA